MNVIQRYCECGKAYPSFNIPTEHFGRWCAQCPSKPKNAINVVKNRCECGKSLCPTYHTLLETKVRWCKDCPQKPLDAINIADAKVCPCGKEKRFGLVGFSSTSCAACRKPGMVSNPMRKCMVNNCRALAIFGALTRDKCENHKYDTDLNLVERNCISCGLMYVLNNDNICNSCNPLTFENFKSTKEMQRFGSLESC